MAMDDDEFRELARKKKMLLLTLSDMRDEDPEDKKFWKKYNSVMKEKTDPSEFILESSQLETPTPEETRKILEYTCDELVEEVQKIRRVLKKINVLMFNTIAPREGPKIFAELMLQRGITTSDMADFSVLPLFIKEVFEKLPKTIKREFMQRFSGRRKVSQSRAAEICGVSIRTIKNWDRGIGTPPLYPGRSDEEKLKEFAREYKVGKLSPEEREREKWGGNISSKMMNKKTMR